MSEQELLHFTAERADINWQIFQFWSGVSFAYLAAAFIAAPRLNWPIIIVLTILYGSLSITVLQFAANNLVVMQAGINDLSSLSAGSSSLSSASVEWVNAAQSTNPVPMVIAIFGTFISALVFMPYNFIRSRDE